MSSPEPPARLQYDNLVVSPRGISELHGRKVMLFVPGPQIERMTLRFGRTDHRPLLTLTAGLLLAAVGVLGIVQFGVSPKGIRWELGMVALGGLGASMIYDTLKQRYFLAVHQRKLDSHLVFSKRAQREEIQAFCDRIREVYRYDIHDAT
ncbi:MAG TPA: hypothetical protein VGO11_20910 [Chthoniobacteraceae bacterium]|jgi:hypothetical protein|nr:hypothetical protein [Chthoniobacteraceae bacterium]